MPTLVSTGQITLVDTNDAKTISAFIASSNGTQQVFSKDESAVSFTPSWFTTALTLTPKLSVSGMTEAQVWACLSSKQFSLTAGPGGAITSATTSTSFVNDANTQVSTPFTVTHAANGSSTASTFAIKGNLKDSVASFQVYFDADFTDPVTGLVTHIGCGITLNVVKTGTNAVYLQMRGKNVIEEGTGGASTKGTARIVADLIRASGIDNSGVTYRWFQSPHAAADQIDGNLPSVTSKYGLLDTAAVNANRAPDNDQAAQIAAIGNFLTGASTTTAISTTNVPDGGWVDAKGLVIHESAVQDIAVYKVEAKDSDGMIYQQFFTVYDISDPYDVQMVSTAGDKLQNGIGSTNIFPRVYNGAARVSDLTGWTFDWQLYDRNGNRGAFVDTTRTAVAGGRNISANTGTVTGSFNFDGAAVTFAAGDLIKVVKPDGTAYFMETAASAGAVNSVTTRALTSNTWLYAYTAPVANEFVGGKLYVCKTANTTNGGATETAAQITVSGDEIDVKGTIMCLANRP